MRKLFYFIQAKIHRISVHKCIRLLEIALYVTQFFQKCWWLAQNGEVKNPFLRSYKSRGDIATSNLLRNGIYII